MFPRGWTSLDLRVILPDGSGNRFWKAWQGTGSSGGGGGRGALDVMRCWLQLSRARGRGGGSSSWVVHARLRTISKGQRSSPTLCFFFYYYYLTGKAFAFLGYLFING